MKRLQKVVKIGIKLLQKVADGGIISSMIKLKRKIEGKLLEWRNRKVKDSALLIAGARQVGKSTLIRDFGKAHYKYFCEINFEEMPKYRDAFNGNLDARTIILNLTAMGLDPFVEGETLIFLDEIQVCPNARTAIKFLVQDGRFDYIESGSLLGINYKDVGSYPVGFEQQLNMYPLDFEEFLWAKGIDKEVTYELYDNYTENKPVTNFLHTQMMQYWREFMVVGGMPEAVANFCDNPDFNETKRIQDKVVKGYRDDISKYAGTFKNLTKNIFDSIPEQLAKQNKRFTLASIEKGASSRKYEDASIWLSDAGIGYHCFNIHSLEMPFALNAKRNLYKLYMLDSGLLCYLSAGNIQAEILLGQIEINEGAITENAIAAELKKHNHELYYFDQKSRNELDFIIKDNKGLSVVEVKSGKNFHAHISLDKVPTITKINRRIVLCRENISVEDGILYLPLYMSVFL